MAHTLQLSAHYRLFRLRRRLCACRSQRRLSPLLCLRLLGCRFLSRCLLGSCF
eukprot:COSAG01_NODE_54364_length_332_cov_1.133047_1_plen_52_part_10